MKETTNWEYIPLEKAVDIFDALREPINNKERAKRIEGKPFNVLFPYYGATGLVGYIDDYILDGDYVLLGEDGAPFLSSSANKAYLISGKAWVNNHAHILKSKTNNKFLCYYLNYFNYKGYVSGTTRLKLTQASMKSILQDAIIDYNDRVKRYNDVKKEKNDLAQKDSLNKKQQSNLRSSIEKKNIDIHNSRTEKTRLTDIIENKSGYSYGVRTILGAKNSLSGICGALGDLIETEETYETALATALGGAVQFIVTRTNDQAKEAIYFLRKNKAGRATFLPIDTMKPRLLRDEAKMLAEQSLGYLGVMSDFVTYDKSISDVVLNQLGNTIVADHLDHATEIAKSIYHRYRVVTLEGDIINVGGSLTGGANKHTNNSMMSKRELERDTPECRT